MNENTKNSFSSILERERKNEDRSLKDLAEILGKDEEGKYNITPSYLNRLEKGEKENPSFYMVCLMIEKLGLDPVEVFKSFGFQNILNYNYREKSSYIQEIIRTSDIVDTLDKNEENKKLLNQKEKEHLIRAINNIFLFGVCEAEYTVDYVTEVIMEMELFRMHKQRYFEREIDINGKKVILYFNKDVKNQMDSIGVSEEYVYDVVSMLGEKLLYRVGKFMVKGKGTGTATGINILLNKIIDNEIIIEFITDYVEEI